MNLMDVNNKNIIIVTQNVAHLVAIPENYPCEIVIASRPADIIEKYISNDNREVIYAIVFAHIDEYSDINTTLKYFTIKQLMYKYVLFCSQDDLLNEKPESYLNVSEFRLAKICSFELDYIIKKTMEIITDIHNARFLEEEYLNNLIATRRNQEDLINIGKSLSSEKDPEKLLRLILFLSKKITGADAGSIYLVEEDERGIKKLRFKFSHTFSRDIPLEEFVIDMNKKSISGYVAVTGEVVNLANAYIIPDSMSYSFNSSFDKQNNYITRSILAVPMRNHVNEIIGVIQLINSKNDPMSPSLSGNEAFEIMLNAPEDFDKHVVNFDEKFDSLLEAIAGQAAVAIENNRMIAQIQSQFEEFVKASVIAIESRDPATSGHSFRVSEICKAMAHAINKVTTGYLGKFTFSDHDIKELELAALLHDFGKVYIDLSVFKKAKKLYPQDLENLIMRLEYVYRFVELQYAIIESDYLKKQKKEDIISGHINALMEEKRTRLDKILKVKNKILTLNEPALLDEDPVVAIKKISMDLEEIECISISGNNMEILTDHDKLNLTIKRGSLNEYERREIESHVLHTYNFVSKIPWPPEYKNIPEIALRHHEKLNGSGYPDGLKGRESTLLQSRIMAIADIFDALAASDRPYKKAVPIAKVIDILREETEKGVLDIDLVKLFIDEKIYEKINVHLLKSNE